MIVSFCCVEIMIQSGSHYEMVVDTSDFSWLIHSTRAAERGEEVGISFGPDDIHIMHKMKG